MTTPTLRVARASENFEALIRFYCDGLGLELLDRFEDHAGFDGIMLGDKAASYHFEFTRRREHPVTPVPSPDNLLVFYIPNRSEWLAAVTRMTDAGFRPVPSFNPYWDTNGKTFEDCDGYRVVLQNGSWIA
jgi:catechol 2,3-dioxygenase-like lactoylglutathione lyase family enzyme